MHTIAHTLTHAWAHACTLNFFNHLILFFVSKEKASVSAHDGLNNEQFRTLKKSDWVVQATDAVNVKFE